MVNDGGIDFIAHAVSVVVFAGTGNRRCVYGVCFTIENQTGWGGDLASIRCCQQIRIGCFQTHFVFEGSDDKLANRIPASLGEEGSDPKIFIDSFKFGAVDDFAIELHHERSKTHPF